jgi:uncharacterized RDD family membrane protein YckC
VTAGAAGDKAATYQAPVRRNDFQPMRLEETVMQKVSLVRRLAAAGVDGLILFFGFGFAISALVGGTSNSPDGVEFQLNGLAALALFASWFVYFVAFEATLGATIGKLLFGVRVRTSNGERIGLIAALIRNLLRVVDVCIAPIGLLLMLISPRHQRLGDHAAGTVVVPS